MENYDIQNQLDRMEYNQNNHEEFDDSLINDELYGLEAEVTSLKKEVAELKKLVTDHLKLVTLKEGIN